MLDNNNSNGNGDIEYRRRDCHVAAHPRETPAADEIVRLALEVSNQRREIINLKTSVGAALNAQAEVNGSIGATRREIAELRVLLEKTIVPLADQNRDFRNKEIDDRFVRPVVVAIAQIIQRQSADISEIDKDMGLFTTVENGRKIDKQELLDLLATLGIDEVSFTRGSKLDTRVHTIKALRPTANPDKVARVARVLRPAYLRQSDGFVFVPAWVEVWGMATT